MVDCEGRSSLFHAMRNNQPEVVTLLLAHQHLKLESVADATILAYACQEQNVECVNIFLGDERCNASIVNQKDEYDNSGLTYAVRQGNSVIVRLILDFPGADPNIADRDGLTPLEFIMNSDKDLPYSGDEYPNYPSHESENILKLLLKTRETKLESTTALDKCSNAKHLALFTADPRCRPELLNHMNKDTGDTYLTKAVKYGMLDIVAVLLDNQDMDCNVGNPLVYTMEENLPDMLALLLTNPSVVFAAGSALITACHRNYVRCVTQGVLLTFLIGKICLEKLL